MLLLWPNTVVCPVMLSIHRLSAVQYQTSQLTTKYTGLQSFMLFTGLENKKVDDSRRCRERAMHMFWPPENQTNCACGLGRRERPQNITAEKLEPPLPAFSSALVWQWWEVNPNPWDAQNILYCQYIVKYITLLQAGRVRAGDVMSGRRISFLSLIDAIRIGHE